MLHLTALQCFCGAVGGAAACCANQATPVHTASSTTRTCSDALDSVVRQAVLSCTSPQSRFSELLMRLRTFSFCSVPGGPWGPQLCAVPLTQTCTTHVSAAAYDVTICRVILLLAVCLEGRGGPSCALCPSGSFSADGGKRSPCSACQPGQTSPRGATNPAQCFAAMMPVS